MTVAIVTAALGFLACLAGAFWLGRRQQDRVAFAALVASPVVAALAFAGVSGAGPKVAAAALAAPEPAPAESDAGTPPPPPAAPVAAASPPPADAPAAAPAAPATSGTGDLDRWRHEAEQLRRARRFAEAKDTYARIVKIAPMDADAWADFGDASAAAAGGDLKAGQAGIDRALELDPRHLKALWLKASLELQQKHFGAAADLWQRLLAQLPKDSNDARIVSANLTETRTLAAQQGAGR